MPFNKFAKVRVMISSSHSDNNPLLTNLCRLTELDEETLNMIRVMNININTKV